MGKAHNDLILRFVRQKKLLSGKWEIKAINRKAKRATITSFFFSPLNLNRYCYWNFHNKTTKRRDRFCNAMELRFNYQMFVFSLFYLCFENEWNCLLVEFSPMKTTQLMTRVYNNRLGLLSFIYRKKLLSSRCIPTKKPSFNHVKCLHLFTHFSSFFLVLSYKWALWNFLHFKKMLQFLF